MKTALIIIVFVVIYLFLETLARAIEEKYGKK